MKRLVLTMALFVFGLEGRSQTRDEILEQFMQERRQMMEQMIQLFQDDFNNDDFFGDESDPFGKSNHFKGSGTSIDIDEKYESDGSISILITPKNKNMSLDIQTKSGVITIKSELNLEQTNSSKTSMSKSISKSSSTRSIRIPRGYKTNSPKPKKGGILISLIPDKKMKKILIPKKKFFKKKKTIENNMVPIGKRPGEDTL